jgi:glyoxylase-like metal-dependent hydrolase (beta-lactamase superfamily II)
MLSIGDVEITRIEEVVLNEPTTLFADWNDTVLEQHRDLMVPHCFNVKDHTFYASIHSYLIKTPGQTILIDTCGGNDKPRPASPRFHMLNIPWLDRLKAAGAAPKDIDTVICTHLHVDHVGWNTRLVDGKWVPTFPNAKYVFPRIEVEWRDPNQGAADKPPATHHVFLDSVLPILEAGKAQLVEGTERWSDEIDFMPTPGHAPGQMAVRVRTGGEEIVFTADIMHQPVQVFNPGWSSKFCEDPVLATKTRKRMFDYFADNKSLVFPAHFGFPHGGYISRRGDGYDFKPLGQNINPA